jgi:hypothetical protein
MARKPICHQALHKSFTNKDLERIGIDLTALRREPALARFLDWIAAKPPDFHAPTRRRR